MSEPDEFTSMLSEGLAKCRERQERFGPITGIYVSHDGKSIDLCLDTSQDAYSEWIKGEGADIALHRLPDGKVGGAHLPCYAKTLVIGGQNFPTIRIDLASGDVVIEGPGEQQNA